MTKTIEAYRFQKVTDNIQKRNIRIQRETLSASKHSNFEHNVKICKVSVLVKNE